MDDEFNKLIEAGWFESWPEEAVKQAKSHFMSCEPEGSFAELSKIHPGLKMSSVFGDAECIYESNSYTTLLKDFAEGSHGLLEVTSVKEDWREVDGDYESVSLSCKVNGAPFNKSLEYQGDWISEDFYEFLEEILGQLYPGLVLYCPEDLYGQDFGYMYINKSCLDANTEHQLLPVDPDEAEGDGEPTEYDPEMSCQIMCGFDDIPEIFQAIYKYDIRAVQAYVESGGDIELRDGMFDGTLIEHVFLAYSYAKEKYFPQFEVLFDYLFSKGANLERNPEEGFILHALTEEDDRLFHEKLVKIGYKPSKESLDAVVEELNSSGQADMVAKVLKDFG